MTQTTTTLQSPSNVGNTNYPFADNATMVSRNGMVVAKTVFLDARVYAPNSGALQFIKSMRLVSGALLVEIADTSGVIATGTYPGSGAVIPLYDKYGRDVGVLYGDPDGISGLSPGDTRVEFDVGALPFVSSVLVPQVQPVVRGIYVKEDELLSGDVWLIGEDGVVLTASEDTISVNIVGDHFFIRKLCASELPAFRPGRPLKTLIINEGGSFLGNLIPNVYGNVFLRPGRDLADDNIIRINPIKYGLQIEVLGNFN